MRALSPTAALLAAFACLAGCGGGGGASDADPSLRITAQPVSGAVATGNTTTFSVATNRTDVTYQWVAVDASTDPDTYEPIAGATANMFTTSSAGSYAVVVTDATGDSVVSAVVTLTVTTPGNATVVVS